MLKNHIHIPTKFSFVIVLVLVLGSCQFANHGNFNKQKYLKGSLRTVHGNENALLPVDLENESESGRFELEHKTTNQGFFELEEVDFLQKDVSGIEASKKIKDVRKKVKPRLLKKGESKRQYIKKRSGRGAPIAWFIILLALGLLSLILFIWIGWWSMLVCAMFFLAAVIVISTFDPPKPRHRNPISGMLMGIILGVIIGGLIAIGILALIIWGLVALSLAIFS